MRAIKLISMTMGLAAGVLAFLGCAAQQEPAGMHAGMSETGAATLAQVSAVRLVANDPAMKQEAASRLRREPGLTVIVGDEDPPEVLTLQVDCGSDTVFMPEEMLHPFCNGMDPDELTARKYTAPESAKAACEMALTLTSAGKPVWWVKEQVRVGSKTDLVFAADRFVDKFLADRRRARTP